MTLSTTIVFYCLFGAGVAAAVAVTGVRGSDSGWLFRVVTAFVFWPLYVPVILKREQSSPSPVSFPGRSPVVDDPLTEAISQVERELDAAIQSLDGWAEEMLLLEQDRFSELRAAWRVQADRILELDKLLAQAEFAAADSTTSVEAVDGGSSVMRLRQSDRARHDNIRKLHAVRQKLADDLTATLAWVRELVTLIHLAKFTGAPASRANELVTQIAASVEGLSEATRLQHETANVG
jgi:hypothetical protein